MRLMEVRSRNSIMSSFTSAVSNTSTRLSLALIAALLLLTFTSSLVSGEPEPGSSSSSSTRKSSSSRSSGHSSNGGSNGAKMNCTTALAKCTRRMPCGMALHDYRISCKQELYGLSKNCSELCQLAIISLASTPEGYDYLHCDCAKNDYCKLIRNRTQSCNPKKITKEGDIETCRGAELYCKADPVCNTSYDYYRRSCTDLIKGKTRECNRRCNNTIGILWRQKAGSALKKCTCEKGSSKCRREREAIMRSCMGINDYRASGMSSTILIDYLGFKNNRYISLAILLILYYFFAAAITTFYLETTQLFLSLSSSSISRSVTSSLDVNNAKISNVQDAINGQRHRTIRKNL